MSIDKDTLKAGFETTFGAASILNYYFCPGRVCLIGEHLDYNGGHVLPTAISLGIYAAVASNSSNTIRCKSASFENELVINLKDIITPVTNDPWGNYVRGVVKYLQAEGTDLRGMDIYFNSNLPHGAGLSSSAAIEVLTAYILLTEQNLPVDLEKIALMCKDVENDFVGMKCGIMDQFAVALCQPNKAIMLDCENITVEYVPFTTGDYQFVIINSNKQRILTESAFNTRKKECEIAAQELNEKYGIQSLATATEEQANSISDKNARKRALHVCTENQRVLDAKTALENGDLLQFGELMKQSHISLKELYEVTGAELDTIAENSWNIQGCIGARMTGAGFGGCCIALVKKEAVENFKHEINNIYHLKHSLSLDFYEFEMNGGVMTLQSEKKT